MINIKRGLYFMMKWIIMCVSCIAIKQILIYRFAIIKHNIMIMIYIENQNKEEIKTIMKNKHVHFNQIKKLK